MRPRIRILVLFGMTIILVPWIAFGGPLVHALSNTSTGPAQFGAIDLASGVFSVERRAGAVARDGAGQRSRHGHGAASTLGRRVVGAAVGAWTVSRKSR